MPKEISYHEQVASTPHKAQSKVTKIILHIGTEGSSDFQDRSYYQKSEEVGRSANLGNVTYEAHGYDLLKSYGIPMPDHKLLQKAGSPILATNSVQGESLCNLSDSQKFSQLLDTHLAHHFYMWLESQKVHRQHPNTFQDIRILCPISEALSTANAIRNKRIESPEFKNFDTYLTQIIANLESVRNPQPTVEQPLFLQHGDEITSNFLYDCKTDQLAAIDTSPILSTRMEKALNKLLGGTLLFDLHINNDGIPTDTEKYLALIELATKYTRLIEIENQKLDISGTNILKDLLFINLARVHYGLYNKENTDYFTQEGTEKFIKLSIMTYNLLNSRNLE